MIDDTTRTHWTREEFLEELATIGEEEVRKLDAQLRWGMVGDKKALVDYWLGKQDRVRTERVVSRAQYAASASAVASIISAGAALVALFFSHK